MLLLTIRTTAATATMLINRSFKLTHMPNQIVIIDKNTARLANHVVLVSAFLNQLSECKKLKSASIIAPNAIRLNEEKQTNLYEYNVVKCIVLF